MNAEIDTDDDWLNRNNCLALVPYVAPPKPKSPLMYFPILDNPSFQPTEEPSSNPTLINDIIPHILQYCDAPTLSRFSSTCSTFHRMANSDELWNRLCQQKFGVLADELRPKPDPVRMLYVLQVKKMRDVYRGRIGGGFGVQRIRSDLLESVLRASF